MPIAKKSKYKGVHEAVKSGDVKALESMVKEGASVNEIDDSRDRFTPLHWAACTGTLECLHWLLWHGADSSVTTPKGWTPAHIAAVKGQDACIQALANNGANLCAKDVRGSTPTHMAAAHGNSYTLQSLLRAGVEANSMDKNSWAPIHYAAFHGRLGCLQLLAKWGGVVDETDSLGNTPAHLAAMEGHLPCLKYLVGEGRNTIHILGARNNNGETPKMLAQQFYKARVVDYITNLEWERDHPEEAQNMSFPAHVAAYSGDLSHLRMLIENRVVNIDEKDDKGSTPLHKAAGQGHLDILRWLVEMGANVKIMNDAGETARDVARRFARLAAMRMLGPDEGDEAELEAEDRPSKMEKRRTERRKKERSIQRREREIDGDDDDDDDYSDVDETISQNDSEEYDEDNSSAAKKLEKLDRGIDQKQSRGRAKKKMEELESLLKIAKQNYIQLGGSVHEQKKKEKEDNELKSKVIDLQEQLDYERNRREQLEALVDEYKIKLIQVQSAADTESPIIEKIRERVSERKKTVRKRSLSRDKIGQFVRRV